MPFATRASYSKDAAFARVRACVHTAVAGGCGIPARCMRTRQPPMSSYAPYPGPEVTTVRLRLTTFPPRHTGHMPAGIPRALPVACRRCHFRHRGRRSHTLLGVALSREPPPAACPSAATTRAQPRCCLCPFPSTPASTASTSAGGRAACCNFNSTPQGGLNATPQGRLNATPQGGRRLAACTSASSPTQRPSPAPPLCAASQRASWAGCAPRPPACC